jgi:hypothetical protein
MKTKLQSYGVYVIWHFTDSTNVQSICANDCGLLSLSESRNRGIKIPTPGGNQWSHDADVRQGMDRFVHLAFLDDHPMLYAAKQNKRITNPVWLKIDAAVLDHPDVRYTMEVSNKTGVSILTAQEAIAQLDFEVLFTRTHWRDPEIQARRQKL